MIIVSLIALSFASILIFLNLKKAKFRPSYELRKNCLLSPYPIVFLSGQRSLIYFYKYWNWIPEFLKDHGYDIMILNLPWRKAPLRRHRLKFFLQTISKEQLPVHIVGDQSCAKDLLWLNSRQNPFIKSCWIIEEISSQTNKALRPEDLRPATDDLLHFYLPQASQRTGLYSWLWRILLKTHNLLFTQEDQLQSQIIGLPALSDINIVQQHYLDFAISLAEQDVKCSH